MANGKKLTSESEGKSRGSRAITIMKRELGRGVGRGAEGAGGRKMIIH